MTSWRRILVLAAGLTSAFSAVFAGVWLHAAWSFSAPQTRSGAEAPPSQAHVLLNMYCASCHANGRAVIDFDGVITQRLIRRAPRVWQHAVAQLQSGRMPPAKSPQPSADERKQLIAWIEESLEQARAETAAPLRARRLDRAEYANTVRDLLGVAVDSTWTLPTDDPAGWDRCTEATLAEIELGNGELAHYRVAAQKIVERLVSSHDPQSSPVSELLASIQQPETRRAGAEQFLRRAYRRSPTALEVDALDKLFVRAGGDRDANAGLAAVLKNILESPQFLCRIELNRSDEHAGPRSDFELASRLSYLIWRSMPDDQLLDQAGAGTLCGNLEREAQRLLADARSGALADLLSERWLGLPSSPEQSWVERELGEALGMETRLFVGGIVRDNRSVLEFLDADYTYLNERLARHYGIANVDGDHFRRVALTGDQRGGLLGQGAIARAMYLDTDTSPVRAGKWVLDNLLGTPPPPPPPDLLSVFFSGGKATQPGSMRQILAQHTSESSCASCHARMDGIGWTLANYDNLGAWRTSDHGEPIDARSTLPSGENLDGPRGLKTYLMSQRELFVRTLASKLLGFALARKLGEQDRAACERLVPVVADADFHFSSVLAEVVRSEPFRK